MSRQVRWHYRTSAVALALSSLFALPTVPCFSQPPVDMDTILHTHENYKKQIQSAQADIDVSTEDSARNSRSGTSTPLYHEQAFWAFKGIQSYARTAYPGIEGATLDHKGKRVNETIYDGEKERASDRYASSHNNVITDAVIRRWKRRVLTNPLVYGYWTVKGEWLADVMKQGKYTVKPAVADSVYGALIEVDSEDRNHEINRFWFARDKGLIAVRTQWENTINHLKHTYEPVTLEERDGLFLPLVGRLDVTDANGQLMTRTTETISNLVLNAVPDSQFLLKLKGPGSLWDETTRIKYLIARDGTLVKQRYIPMKSPGGGFPVRWIFIVASTVLIITLVIAGARWRRVPSE